MNHRLTALQPQKLTAIDVQAVPAAILAWDSVNRGIRAEDLPRSEVSGPISPDRGCAVLSWRWDVAESDGSSVNLALALKHAQESGIRYLFVDLITIDQAGPQDQLLRTVAGLAELYRTIPVVAAYDEKAVAAAELENTLGRPWILSEARAFSQNPTTVTYVGYRHEPGQRRHLLFANELSVIRSSGFASCILDIMHGNMRITDVADFAYILTGFTDVVRECFRIFSVADYLMATFLLTLAHEKTQQVQDGKVVRNRGFRTNYGALSFEKMGLTRFSIAAYEGSTRSFESAQTLQLDGHPVAICWSKMTSSFDRNWIEVLPSATDLILDLTAPTEDAKSLYRSCAASRTAFLQIPPDAPTPSVREKGADLNAGKWLDRLPHPQATTVGFRPGLWLK